MSGTARLQPIIIIQSIRTHTVSQCQSRVIGTFDLDNLITQLNARPSGLAKWPGAATEAAIGCPTTVKDSAAELEDSDLNLQDRPPSVTRTQADARSRRRRRAENSGDPPTRTGCGPSRSRVRLVGSSGPEPPGRRGRLSARPRCRHPGQAAVMQGAAVLPGTMRRCAAGCRPCRGGASAKSEPGAGAVAREPHSALMVGGPSAGPGRGTNRATAASRCASVIRVNLNQGRLGRHGDAWRSRLSRSDLGDVVL
jgi:hypothetical protein